MKPRVTAVELAEIAGIDVSTLFVTARMLREALNGQDKRTTPAES